MDRIDSRAPFHAVFFLVPGFSMMALSSAVEPLRAVNRLLGYARYSWTLAGEVAGPVPASNGIDVATSHDVGAAPRADLTVVVASLETDRYQNQAVHAWLRRLRAERRLIGAISNGTLVLARAGILGARRVTIHWERQRELAETFPDLDVCSELYCWDRGILTAAGGTAAMDMMLALISELDGRDLAADVADQFLHGPVRASTEMQRQDVRWRFQVTDRRLVTAIRLMEEKKANPLKISKIAEVAGISERQLERLFVTELGKTPSEFYKEVRLKAARNWLLNSTDSLDEISEKTGFSSLGHFSRSYKIWSGEAPSVTRRLQKMQNGGIMQIDGDAE